MPRVFIPPLLRPLTNGVSETIVEGDTVRVLIDNLEVRFPGFRDRLCDDDELKSSLRVTVDCHVSVLGLLESVGPDSEVHFLPAISGG